MVCGNFILPEFCKPCLFFIPFSICATYCTLSYCLPDVCLPPEEERPIGVYGQRRRAFLKAHHRVLYYNLLTAGTLGGHLADIEEQAQELFLRLVEQYADTEGVTEALKADDPMAWVRKMNGIRNRANEIMMQEIVYG